MKQIEITTYVKQSLDEIDKILPKLGFSLLRKSRIEDKYMIQDLSNLSKNNIIEHLQKCVLIRYLCVNGEYISSKLTYKNKEYDDNGTVLTENRIDVNIDNNDIANAEELLKTLGFQKLIDVNYDCVVYKNSEVELAFQDVEGLGLLLEYENIKDFENASDEEIICEKRKMLEEVRNYNIDISDDYDVKKAYELVIRKGV